MNKINKINNINKINTIYDNFMKPLFDNIRGSINYINKKNFIKKTKLDFNKLIFILVYSIGNKQSIGTAVSDNEIDKITLFDKSTISKRCKLLPINNFKLLNESIINSIIDANSISFVAVDLTVLHFNSYVSDFLPLCKNNQAYAGYVSTLYDVDSHTVLDYYVHDHANEREALLFQLQQYKLKKNSILIFDRGYFSDDIFNIFLKCKINFIFRLKKDCQMVIELNKSEKYDMICYNNGKPARIIKYKIENNDYYLATNLNDTFDIDFFKNTYHKRWAIETHFKYAKYVMSLENIQSKTYLATIQNIQMHQFVNNISTIIQFHLNKLLLTNNPDYIYKINLTAITSTVAKKLIKIILFEKNEKVAKLDVCDILVILLKKIVISKKGRKNDRRRKKPLPKFVHGINEKLNNKKLLDEITKKIRLKQRSKELIIITARLGIKIIKKYNKNNNEAVHNLFHEAIK